MVEVGEDGAIKVGKNLLIDAGELDRAEVRLGDDRDEEGRHDHHRGQGHHRSTGSGKINVKASGEITMKGSKINQN